MTVVTLRPNGTSSNTGAVTGAASAHAALNDNSDSSYVTLDMGESVTLNTGDLTLPAGAVIKSTQLRGRIASAVNLGIVEGRVDVTGASGVASQIGAGAPPPSTYNFTASTGHGAGNYTDAEVDSALLVFSAVDPFSSGLDPMNVYEAYLNVTLVTIPVVTVTAPTGTITNANRPTVTWSNVIDSDGGSQTHYQIKVFTDSQYGIGGFDPSVSLGAWDSGAVASGAQARDVDVVLADDTYRAYVRVAQTVNGVQHWSAWDFEGFVINVARPAAPTMTLTAEPDEGRIRITLDDNAGAATTDTFILERSVDGFTWQPVRSAAGDDGLVAANTTSITVYDYEAPNGTTVGYRACAVHYYGASRVAGPYETDPPNNFIINPSFETGVHSWSVSGGTLEQENSPAEGLWAGKFAGSVTNNNASMFSDPLAIGVSPGEPVSARARIQVNDAFNSDPGRIVVQFDNGSNAWTLGSADGPLIPAGTGQFQATIANAIAPASTTQARLRLVGSTTGTDSFDWRVDAVIAAKTATVPDYFDGDSQWGLWSGARGASASRMARRLSWSSTQWWLKHPNVPSLNMPVELFSYANVERAARRGVFHPVGARRPVVISDTRGSEVGVVVVQMRTEADRDLLDALLDTTDVLLLQGPAAAGEPDRYVSVGDASTVRVVDNADFHIRRATLPWVRVDVPLGAITGGEYTG